MSGYSVSSGQARGDKFQAGHVSKVPNAELFSLAWETRCVDRMPRGLRHVAFIHFLLVTDGEMTGGFISDEYSSSSVLIWRSLP